MRHEAQVMWLIPIFLDFLFYSSILEWLTGSRAQLFSQIVAKELIDGPSS